MAALEKKKKKKKNKHRELRGTCAIHIEITVEKRRDEHCVAVMKFLEDRELGQLNNFLAHVNLGDHVVTGQLENYSCE